MSKTIYQIVECNINYEIIATTGKFYENLVDANAAIKETLNAYEKVDNVQVELWSLHPWTHILTSTAIK